jgi:putative heme-binding domain-containing protein
MGESSAVPALLTAAAKLDEGLPEDAAVMRIQEHSVIYALIEIGDAAATRVGLTAQSPGTRRAALIALDQMDHGGLRVDEVMPLLTASDTGLKSAALWTAGNHPEWGAAFVGYFREQLAGARNGAGDRSDLQRRLMVFERDAAIQQLVADHLCDDSLEPETRLLLLRSVAESRLPEIPAVWIAALGVQLAGADETIARSTIEAVRALPLEKADVSGLNQALWRLAGDPLRSEDLRVEAMAAVTGAIGTLGETHFELLLNQLDPALSVSRRGAAANVLARATLSPAQLLELAEAMKTVGPMELNQLLEAFAETTDGAVGLALVAALEDSKFRGSVRADLLQRRLGQFPESVQEEGQELLAGLNVNPVEQNARLNQRLAELAALPADVRRGQRVFNSQQAACATCHTIGYVGGKVGPDLTSIGQIRTERDLLEAVLYPSASFVRNYEPLIAATKAGDEYGGVLVSETADDLVLNVGAESRVRVSKADITELRPGSISVMPTGLEELLTAQDLADLMVFLKNTRWGAQ